MNDKTLTESACLTKSGLGLRQTNKRPGPGDRVLSGLEILTENATLLACSLRGKRLGHIESLLEFQDNTLGSLFSDTLRVKGT